MFPRTIRHEHGAEEQFQQLGVGYERYDNMMLAIEETLTSHPEAFPVIQGTKLSICKTNEFVGAEFSEIPSLVIFFHYDDQHIYIIAVESNGLESYSGF